AGRDSRGRNHRRRSTALPSSLNPTSVTEADRRGADPCTSSRDDAIVISTQMTHQNPSAAGPELVFGLVGATGSNLGPVTSAIEDGLASVGYSCKPETIRVAKLLHAF